MLLPTRRGELEGGTRFIEREGEPDEEVVDASVPRFVISPAGSIGDRKGAAVNVAGLAGEGPSEYPATLNGRHFTKPEFEKLVRFTIAHELGHLLVGPLPLLNPGKVTIMEHDHALVLADGKVLGLDDVVWDNEEIKKVNLPGRLSATAPAQP